MFQIRIALFTCVLAALISAQTRVTTANYNVCRTNGASDSILNPSNVNVDRFGKLHSVPVDGYIVAQPLYLPSVQINGGQRNVLYVCTLNNSVYAFDADDTGGGSLWQVNLGPAMPRPNGLIQNQVGIMGTPVIDPGTNTLYVVAQTGEIRTSAHWLHALDVSTGAEKYGGPVAIAGSVPGTGYDAVDGIVSFHSTWELQRSGLLLYNDVVYIAFGNSFSDPLHGWIMGYGAKDLQQKYLWCVSPNGYRGGVWQSGGGLSADAAGIYAATADGSAGAVDRGSSFVRLSADLIVQDWFTPRATDLLNALDWDLGTTSILLIPGSNLAVAGSKPGILFLMNRSSLGRTSSGLVQAWQAASPCQSASWASCYQIHNMAYLQGSNGTGILYIWPWKDYLKAFYFNGAGFGTRPIVQNTSVTPNFPGGMLSITQSPAGQPASAILWATMTSEDAMFGGAVPGSLHAYDAATLTELWNSTMNRDRDDLGLLSKFGMPTIANGKVYVPTFSNQLAVYGLTPAQRQRPAGAARAGHR